MRVCLFLSSNGTAEEPETPHEMSRGMKCTYYDYDTKNDETRVCCCHAVCMDVPEWGHYDGGFIGAFPKAARKFAPDGKGTVPGVREEAEE